MKSKFNFIKLLLRLLLFIVLLFYFSHPTLLFRIYGFFLGPREGGVLMPELRNPRRHELSKKSIYLSLCFLLERPREDVKLYPQTILVLRS